MVETGFSQQIINAAAMLPILGAVYRSYFKNPIVVSTKEQIIAAIKQLRAAQVIELPLGSHDVTPVGTKMNYTLQVLSDEPNDDTICQLQITNSSPGVISHRKTTTETLVPSDNSELLDYGKSITIAEPFVQGKVKIFGMLFCERKGEKIFTE